MSNLIAVSDMTVMAEAIVKSNFYGFKTKEQVMAVMLVAQAEGKHPATVVQEYDIIQNRPALKSQAMLARFQLAGGTVQWDSVSSTAVKGTFKHTSGGSLTVEWTIEMAKQAGLYREGSGWTKYPEDMLRSRVISRAVRSVYPACILGHYAVEEVQDFQTAPAVKDMGMVEEVPQVPQEPDGAYALYVPGNEEPYNRFHTVDEWLQGYVDMIARIHHSTKMPEAIKAEKIDSLKVCNMDMIDSLDSLGKAKIKANMVKAGVPLSPKSESSPLSPEVVHSETIS